MTSQLLSSFEIVITMLTFQHLTLMTHDSLFGFDVGPFLRGQATMTPNEIPGPRMITRVGEHVDTDDRQVMTLFSIKQEVQTDPGRILARDQTR